MAFAVKIISREHGIKECTPLMEDSKYAAEKNKLLEMLKPMEDAGETGLIIHDDKCFGCGNCVVACPVNVANDPEGAAIGDGPSNDKVILKVVDGVVVAQNVGECRRFGKNRILCNACIDPCPSGAIEFV